MLEPVLSEPRGEETKWKATHNMWMESVVDFQYISHNSGCLASLFHAASILLTPAFASPSPVSVHQPILFHFTVTPIINTKLNRPRHDQYYSLISTVEYLFL